MEFTLSDLEENPTKLPSSDDLRKRLLEKCNEFSELSGLHLSKICILALGDHKFAKVLENPEGNFTVAKYQKLLDYLNENWPKEAPSA